MEPLLEVQEEGDVEELVAPRTPTAVHGDDSGGDNSVDDDSDVFFEEDAADEAVASEDEDLQRPASGARSSGSRPASRHERSERKKVGQRAAANNQEDEEDVVWAVEELPELMASPGSATLEVFHLKKWREISKLARLMSAPCFHGIRLAGDDRALYEGFFRAFPHHQTTKARFTSVLRRIYGIPAVHVSAQEQLRSKKGGMKATMNGDSNDGHDRVKYAAMMALDRHLESLQFVCERSGSNVPMLHWRVLLVALRMFLEPLLTMREHLLWAFSVFASSGCLEISDADVVDATDVTLILTHPLRSPAAVHLVSERLRAALDMLPSSRTTSLKTSVATAPTSSSTRSRISYRVFRRLLHLPPLRALVGQRVTPHTSVLDELSSPVYREHVFTARRREHNKRVLRRLRYYQDTKMMRLCFHTWARLAAGRKAARSSVGVACSVLTRTKKRSAFQKLRRHALASIAALEIQRVFRGLRGRLRADAAWRQMQAVLAVQGAFRMRAHFTRHLRALRRRNVLAIRVQRVYRGRLGRIRARQRLLAFYYREMAAIQQEREVFRAFVREEMARRLQRFFRGIVISKQRARREKEELARQAAEQTMLENAQGAAHLAARRRREVSAEYDRVREETELKARRRRVDDLEKQKVVRLRRSRQWEVFKAEKVAHKEALKRQAAERYDSLKLEWETTIAEQTRRRGLIATQVLALDEPDAEWKTLHAQLQRRVKERVKQLSAKYKAQGVAVPKKEVLDRAQQEIVAEETEEQRRKTESEWLQAEADFLRQLDDEEEERELAENSEERAMREKSAVRLQCAFRMFAARKLLRQELRLLYAKDFDAKTREPRYRNKTTGKSSSQKPRGLGSDELEYEDHWVVIQDDVLGEPFYYNPKRMLQRWEKPDECRLCRPCSSAPGASTVVFAAVWNWQEDTYLCQSCYEQEATTRGQRGDFQANAYAAYDGSRRDGQ